MDKNCKLCDPVHGNGFISICDCQCHIVDRGVGDIVNNLVKNIAENRAKIIDDFAKVFIASRWEDYFSKKGKIDFRRIELVETVESPTTRTYTFRFKKGKLPKHKSR